MRPLAVAAVLLLVSAAPAGGAVSFDPAQNSTTGASPEGLVSAPVAGNSAPDIAAAFQLSGGGTSLLLNNGAGAFPALATNLANTALSGNTDVATGDFNNDGRVDLLAAGTGGSHVELHLGNGAGGFGAGSAVAGAAASNGVTTGFFNADGNLDFASAPSSGSSLQVFLGNGNGTFGSPTAIPLPAGTTSALPLADDLNGDGRADLAVVDARGGSNANLTVLRSDGSGGFVETSGSPFDLGFSAGGAALPPGLAAGDLNNDGNDDIAVADSAVGGGVRVLLGNGDGSLKTPVPAATGNQYQDIAVTDFDNDGNQDLALVRTVSPGSPGVTTIFLGNGTGTGFSAGGSVSAGTDALHVVTDDFNRDGNPDLATSNEGSQNVSVFLAKPPTVSVSPGSLGFGNQDVGTTSGTQTVTVTNNGPQTIGPVASITGPNAGDFERVDDRCSPATVVLAPGANCIVGVHFRPGSSGEKNATLELASNAAGSPQKVPLSGTGVQPPAIPTTPVVPIIDRTPPRQTISFPRQTLKSVLRDGLIMFAACSEPCAFRADALVKSSTKKPRRRRGRAARMVTAGAANAVLGSARHRVVVRIRKSARRALTRTRKLTLVTTATDTAGNASRARRGLKLRRR